MPTRANGPSAAPAKDTGATGTRGSARRQTRVRVLAITLAVLVGALGGLVLHVLLEAL